MDVGSVVVGAAGGSALIGCLFAFLIGHVRLIRVNYKIVLRGDNENDPIKLLNTFNRVYWKQSKAEKDIIKLLQECEDVRSNYIGGNDFILSLIDENFDIDYKRIHLEYSVESVKPM